MKLLWPLTLLVLVLLLLGGLIGLTALDLHLTMEWVRSEQAYYLAEAGLLRGSQALERDPTWRGDAMGVPFGAGQFTVKVVDTGGNLHIDTTARIGPVRSRLSQKVTP